MLGRSQTQLRCDQDGIDFETFEPFAQSFERLDRQWQATAAVVDLAKRRVEHASGDRRSAVYGTRQSDVSRFGTDVVPAIDFLQVTHGWLSGNRFKSLFESRVTPRDFECTPD